MPTRRITELLQEVGDENYFSCEFFPPKTAHGVENLIGRCRRLVDLGALFVSVTWATGGPHAEQTLELASRFQNEVGVTTLLHLTCTNMDLAILDHALETAKKNGICNILALRGDPPRDEYAQHSTLSNACDLVRYIREKHGDYFCIGVAGYPEGHIDSAADEQSVDKDLPYLVDKIEAGADFIVTQLVYDASKILNYTQRLRDHSSGSFKNIPVLPGLMPINSYRSLLRSAKLTRAEIPQSILDHLETIDLQDDLQVKAYGVEVLSAIIQSIQAQGIRGVHFYTMNLEKSVAQIVERCRMVHRQRSRRGSRAGAPTSPPRLPLSRAGSPMTWDDFTNGRFSDPHSAAFGQTDGYGPLIYGSEDGRPNEQWGPLNTAEDIAELFVSHITNEIDIIPFSDQPLSAETALIQEELITLNRAGKWTLSSQPSTPGSKSTDRIFGWGPPNGRVYQKAFVEFLCTSSDWHALRKRLIELPENTVTYFAANETSEVETNAGSSPTVVTWGEWEDQTAQSTLLTVEAVKVWRTEAFRILREWQKLYPANSASYKLLGKEADDRYLVTIAYNDTSDGLWQLLIN